jgi:general secretion pathway protein N
MSKLDVRPRTLSLLTGAVLLGFAATWLATGAGQTPNWLPASDSAQLPRQSSTLAQLPELDEEHLQAAWRRPLFSATRSPDQAAAVPGATRLEGLVLSGVILDGAIGDRSQWALLRKQDKQSLKLKLGDTLDNGWTLSELTARAATFTRQGQTQTLSLPELRLPPLARRATAPSSITPFLTPPLPSAP